VVARLRGCSWCVPLRSRLFRLRSLCVLWLLDFECLTVFDCVNACARACERGAQHQNVLALIVHCVVISAVCHTVVSQS
jgi:hypothetical protein